MHLQYQAEMFISTGAAGNLRLRKKNEEGKKHLIYVQAKWFFTS